MIFDQVGIVVIGRNEGVRLINCLRSLPSDVTRIVYVDSGSTDGSVAVADRLATTVVSLNANQPFTAGRARNIGFVSLRKFGNIQFVQFIDGDCELQKGWLNTAVEFIRQRDDIAVVCGRRREKDPSVSIYNHLCDLEWDTPVGQTSACGGDSLMRVEAFESAGGFRESLIAGEEPELCLRLREKGWKVWRLDVEMTRHDASITRLTQWWARAVRFGYCIAEVTQLHWNSPFAIWKRELARAIFWGGVLPLCVGLSAPFYPTAIIAMLLYPLQVCKIAVVEGPMSSDNWKYAFFLTLAKFAELRGILKFIFGRLYRRPVRLIEYK